jgi:glycosyltransferase 2 family protein
MALKPRLDPSSQHDFGPPLPPQKAPRPSKLRRWLTLAVGTAVTVVLLYWAFRDVSWGAVWASLRTAHWGWLLLAWMAHLSVYWARAWRWGTLLSASTAPGRFSTRLNASFIGFGAASVLPAYAGEFVRAAVLYRFDRVPISAAVGSIFAERLLDVGMVFLLLLLPLSLGLLPTHSGLSQFPIETISIVILMVWALFLLGAIFPRAIANSAGSSMTLVGLGQFQKAVTTKVYSFLQGLSVLRQPQRSGLALVQTALGWVLNGITYWAGLIAFNITEPGIPGAFMTQSLSALAIALPASPGYIGPFEAAIRFALGIYAIPADTALAYALALRVLMYVTIPIIALGIATRLGFSQSDLR